MRRMIQVVAIGLAVLFFAAAAGAEYCHFGWTYEGDFAGYRYRHAAAVDEGLLYLYGGTAGMTSRGDLQVYDPATGAWTALPDMPAVKSNFGFAAVDGYLYAVAGEGPISRETDVYRYDTLYGSWSSVAAYPANDPLLIGMVCADGGDGKLYCFGGLEPSVIGTKFSLLAFAYDPTTDAWSAIADLPGGVAFGYAALLDGKIVLTGGYPMESATYAYDVATGAYADLSEPSPRHGPLLAEAGGLLWLTAGGDVWDELVVDDQYYDGAWGAVGTAYSPGRVGVAGGYIAGHGVYMTGGEWSDEGGGTTDTYLWHTCVPLIEAVAPATGSPGAALTITASVFEENITGYLYDQAKAEYPLNDLTVVDEATLTATVPAALPPGVYGLALVGSLGQTGRLDDAFTQDESVADDDTMPDDDDTTPDDDDDDTDDDDDDDQTLTHDDDDDDDDGCGC
ncbi:MAG TPA: hypothetical protein PK961_04295 [bacterium]|nr:hypothetical protein [bacterium]